jgi:multidrug efflux system membrane fusion protein
MRLVRLAVLASVVVAVGGAAWIYRDQVAQKIGLSAQLAQKLGLSAPANAADQGGSSPAASAQPQGRRGRANPGAAIPVVAITVAAKPMPIMIEAVGTVQAIASIQIKPRLDSQIMKVNVEEGALVKEGDLLFELDQRSLKAQLAQIEAQIRKDQAQVAQAKRDSSRSEDLLGKGAATIVTRDNNQTSQKAAEAQLESDEAMRTNILTQLTFTEIRAPVSGRIGSIPSKAGTTVRTADNTASSVLAVINQVDPIYVQFAIPQVYLPELRAAMAQGNVTVNALIDDKRKQSGVVAFIENTVDPMTGTVMAKAKIANANEGLWPGQFVKAEIVLGNEPQALSVPAPAVQLGPQGPYIFVVKDGNVAEVRPINIKRTQGGESVVGSGLKAGEQVVTDGQLRLVNGASVIVKPAQNEAPKIAQPRG